MKLEGKKINFLGDSITQGVGVATEAETYHQLLKMNAGLAEARNYGISGTRIARQKKPTLDNPSFDRDFLMRVPEMDADADVIVVFGGTNDFGHGDAPLGTFEDRTPDTYYGACHLLMQALLTRYIDCPIVFMTPLHRTNEDRMVDGVVSTDPADHLSTYVRILTEVAAYYALPVLDLYRCSGIQPELDVIREKYCPDGLHPCAAGHVRIASLLQGFLETL